MKQGTAGRTASGNGNKTFIKFPIKNTLDKTEILILDESDKNPKVIGLKVEEISTMLELLGEQRVHLYLKIIRTKKGENNE